MKYKVWTEIDGVQLEGFVTSDYQEARQKFESTHKEFRRRGYFSNKRNENEYRLSDEDTNIRIRLGKAI